MLTLQDEIYMLEQRLKWAEPLVIEGETIHATMQRFRDIAEINLEIAKLLLPVLKEASAKSD